MKDKEKRTERIIARDKGDKSESIVNSIMAYVAKTINNER